MQGNHAVLLTHGYWQRRFGGDPGIVGHALTMDGLPYTVVGVLPPDFHFALRGASDAWVPLSLTDDERTRRSLDWLDAIGRLEPGLTIEQAAAEMRAISARLGDQYPDSKAGPAPEPRLRCARPGGGMGRDALHGQSAFRRRSDRRENLHGGCDAPGPGRACGVLAAGPARDSGGSDGGAQGRMKGVIKRRTFRSRWRLPGCRGYAPRVWPRVSGIRYGSSTSRDPATRTLVLCALHRTRRDIPNLAPASRILIARGPLARDTDG
jgi:hypothetical protein